MRFHSFAGALGAIALVLSACTPAPAAPTAPAAQAPAQAPTGAPTPATAQIVRGGTLSWGYTTIPLKLDPVWTQSRTDGIILSQIIQGLVLPNAQGTGVEPGLADTWTVSEDGLTYTFHLRAGVKFHNGKVVTPEDVIASLERDRTVGTYKWSLENVQSIDKVDSSTVKITLGSKVASFLARIANNPNAVFPAEEVAKVGADEITQPIGTGPFKFKEWVRGDHLTLERNPDYWQMGEDGKPLPYLDAIELRQIPEDSTKVLQIQAGSLNGTEGLPWSQVTALQSDARGQVVLLPQQQIYFMEVNVRRPPFDDVKVRQAMSLALDRQVFVDRATAGGNMVDVLVLEYGIAQFARTERDLVEAPSGAVHVDVLHIEHVDVRTVVVALADPGRTAVQEGQVLRFHVGFGDAHRGVAEIRTGRIGIGPQGADETDAVLGLCQFPRIAEFGI